MPADTLSSPVSCEIARLVEILSIHRFRFATEKELQDGVASLFASFDLSYRREYSLGSSSIVDFFFPQTGVAVEVKTKGGLSELTRQLSRYAAAPPVSALVLVTTLSRLGNQPEAIGGKSLTVIHLPGGLQ